MLYKMTKTDNKYDTLTTVGFKDFAHIGLKEKDLENLISANLFDGLFEDNQLMPIFQERQWRGEADIYALDKEGNLVIFELKRAGAASGAVHQALRYCENASPWNYDKLQNLYEKYIRSNTPEEKDADLQKDHKDNFEFDTPLEKKEFNRKQRLIIVGSAANNSLMQTVDYWKRQGLEVDFIPYRIYEINNEYYFEFFSIPYDSHLNPAFAKGVIFDTCKTYFQENKSVWYMCDNDRVAAFGKNQHIINYLNRNDIIFLYNKGQGIIAAGKVKSDIKKDEDWDALYKDLEWLTEKPTRENIKGMPAWKIKQVLERGFFWATTIKTPYLTNEQPQKLLLALKEQRK